MNNRQPNISFLSKLTRFLTLLLLTTFIYSAVVLPLLEYQQIEFSIVEVMGDKETENEVEEIEDDLDQPIQGLLPPLFSQKKSILIKDTDAKHELHHILFSPPPEQV